MIRKTDEHESYGILNISRVSRGGATNLFGSSIRHNRTIALRIGPATKSRSLNSDYYSQKGVPYIEVEMSNAQFAEAITSLNCGVGTPVTVRYVNGDKMADCPEEDKRLVFEKEFREDMEKLTERIRELGEDAKRILSASKAPTKKEKSQILKELEMIEQDIEKNLPFVQKQFNEQMDKTVLEAKGDVEAFISHKINALGLEALKEQFPKLAGGE